MYVHITRGVSFIQVLSIFASSPLMMAAQPRRSIVAPPGTRIAAGPPRTPVVSGVSSTTAGNRAQTASVLPALPQANVDTTFPTVTGQSTVVPDGADFQAALNNANCGDELVLQAGAVYTGNFYVPAKSCSSKIL